jgi:hypothetical protein
MTEEAKMKMVWTQAEIDAEMGLDDDCWQCGGEGYIFVCQDEIGCIDPENGCDLCQRRCDVCNLARAQSEKR